MLPHGAHTSQKYRKTSKGVYPQAGCQWKETRTFRGRDAVLFKTATRLDTNETSMEVRIRVDLRKLAIMEAYKDASEVVGWRIVSETPNETRLLWTLTNISFGVLVRLLACCCNPFNAREIEDMFKEDMKHYVSKMMKRKGVRRGFGIIDSSF